MTLLVKYYIDNVVSLSSSFLPLIYGPYILAEPHPRRYKCGLSAPCPPKHLAFRLVSGAANVIGPKICLEDKMWDSVFTSSSLFVCVFASPAVSFAFCFVFSHCSFFPLCYHNQASTFVWGAICKYCFNPYVPHLYGFICSRFIFVVF